MERNFFIGFALILSLCTCLITILLSRNSRRNKRKWIPSIVFLPGMMFLGIGPQFMDYAYNITVNFKAIFIGISCIIGFLSSVATILALRLCR